MSERLRASAAAFPQPGNAGLSVREYLMAHVLCGLCHRLNFVDVAFAAVGIPETDAGPPAHDTIVRAALTITDAALAALADDQAAEVDLGGLRPDDADPTSDVDLQPDDGRM